MNVKRPEDVGRACAATWIRNKLNRRIKPVIRALAANPTDECLVQILCAHIWSAVRTLLAKHVMSVRPWLSQDECFRFLKQTFDHLFAVVVADIRSGGLDLATLRDPVSYILTQARLAFEATFQEVITGDAAIVLQLQSPPYSEGLKRALAELDEELRFVLHLRLFLGLPLGDIAAILDVPQATVQIRLETGVRQLRDLLGG